MLFHNNVTCTIFVYKENLIFTFMMMTIIAFLAECVTDEAINGKMIEGIAVVHDKCK